MKYSFRPSELNNWKARITERLVSLYISNQLMPRLRKEGFDLIYFEHMPLPPGFIVRVALMGERNIDWEDDSTIISFKSGEKVMRD